MCELLLNSENFFEGIKFIGLLIDTFSKPGEFNVMNHTGMLYTTLLPFTTHVVYKFSNVPCRHEVYVQKFLKIFFTERTFFIIVFKQKIMHATKNLEEE
jgi:hypothetical protein